jgi:hypothetical protein
MTYIATLIAAIVALISIQQYFLAHERFKLDLFEKRFSIFKAAETFLSEIINRDFSGDCLQKFDIETQTAVFLFGKDIVSFLKEIRLNANKIKTLREMHIQFEAGSNERHELVEKEIKIMESIMDTQKSLTDTFSRYLKFRNWKYKFLSGISN